MQCALRSLLVLFCSSALFAAPFVDGAQQDGLSMRALEAEAAKLKKVLHEQSAEIESEPESAADVKPNDIVQEDQTAPQASRPVEAKYGVGVGTQIRVQANAQTAEQSAIVPQVPLKQASKQPAQTIEAATQQNQVSAGASASTATSRATASQVAGDNMVAEVHIPEETALSTKGTSGNGGMDTDEKETLMILLWTAVGLVGSAVLGALVYHGCTTTKQNNPHRRVYH